MDGETREANPADRLSLEKVLTEINPLLEHKGVGLKTKSLSLDEFEIVLNAVGKIQVRCIFDLRPVEVSGNRPTISFQVFKDGEYKTLFFEGVDNWKRLIELSVLFVEKALERPESPEVNFAIELGLRTKADTIREDKIRTFLSGLEAVLQRDFSVLWYYWTGEINMYCLLYKEHIKEHPELYKYDRVHKRFIENLSPKYKLRKFENFKKDFNKSKNYQ